MQELVRTPESFPEQVTGRLVRIAGEDWLLSDRGRWRVQVESSLPHEQLQGWVGKWMRVRSGPVIAPAEDLFAADASTATRVPTAQPKSVDAPPKGLNTSHGVVSFRSSSTKPRTSSESTARGARDFLPFTETSVAGLVGQRRREARIKELGEGESPSAWVELASCWELPELRAATERVLGRIGWRRLEAFFSGSNGWSSGFRYTLTRGADLERDRIASRRREIARQSGGEARRNDASWLPEAWLAAGWTPSDARPWFSRNSRWIPDPVEARQWWNAGLRDVDLIWELHDRLDAARFSRELASARRFEPGLAASDFARRLLEANEGQQEAPQVTSAWAVRHESMIAAAGMRAPKFEVMRAVLQEAEFECPSDGAPPFQYAPGQDWLDEVITKADNLRPMMRRSPTVWPAVLHAPGFTVVVYEVKGHVGAWVGVGSRGLLFSYDSVTFKATGATKHPGFRFAIGVAVSWLVDLALVQPAVSPPGMLAVPKRTEGGSSVGSKVDRYVTTSAYEEHVRLLSNGTRLSPRGHRVTGFVRTLPFGQRPSYEAVANAPAHLRAQMGPRDTFVRDHFRGGEEQIRLLKEHFSNHSFLADTIAAAAKG